MCKGWMWLGLFVICIPFTLQAESGTWQQLFNGKDLTGWKHVGPGSHMVEDGLIKSKGGMGLLYWTGGKLGNCTIRVVFQMRDHNSNSGVFIRIPIEPREEWMPVHYGYEVQIDNEPEKSNEDDYHIRGVDISRDIEVDQWADLRTVQKGEACPQCEAGTLDIFKAMEIGHIFKLGTKYSDSMEITLDGPHTVVVLNGAKVTDYTEGDPVPERKFDFEPQRGRRPLEGYIGLQNHSDSDVVFFKEVAIKKLKK